MAVLTRAFLQENGFLPGGQKKSGRITDGRKAGFHCIYGHMQKRGGGVLITRGYNCYFMVLIFSGCR